MSISDIIVNISSKHSYCITAIKLIDHSEHKSDTHGADNIHNGTCIFLLNGASELTAAGVGANLFNHAPFKVHGKFKS